MFLSDFTEYLGGQYKLISEEKKILDKLQGAADQAEALKTYEEFIQKKGELRALDQRFQSFHSEIVAKLYKQKKMAQMNYDDNDHSDLRES